MSDVELYIIKFDPDKQDRLFKVRAIMRERFPNASERIYYGIPTMEVDGKIVIQYAAYKKHISLLIGNILSLFLKEKHPQYNYTEYTAVLPDKEPFPEDFIKEISTMLG